MKNDGCSKNSLEDADVALLIVDVNEDLKECDEIFTALKLKSTGYCCCK